MLKKFQKVTPFDRNNIYNAGFITTRPIEEVTWTIFPVETKIGSSENVRIIAQRNENGEFVVTIDGPVYIVCSVDDKKTRLDSGRWICYEDGTFKKDKSFTQRSS